MSGVRPVLRRLRGARRGIAATEFALLAPAMILLITGTVEVAHYLMVKISLEGAVARAARESVARLDLGDDQRDAAMRARITDLMSPHLIAPGGALTIETTVYKSFGTAYPEAYEDLNDNGVYDEGEPFDDRNHNGKRDLDVPVAGKMGDVGDVVAYKVVFPVAPYFDFLKPVFGEKMDLSTYAVARNEPEKGAITP